MVSAAVPLETSPSPIVNLPLDVGRMDSSNSILRWKPQTCLHTNLGLIQRQSIRSDGPVTVRGGYHTPDYQRL
jgi:hypothetical protein